MDATPTLRSRILAGVGTLALLSLFGSAASLYRITEVNRGLDAINLVSVPLGRILVQVRSDAILYGREFERRLGVQHWSDAHWQPRPIPRWIEDVLLSEIQKSAELVAQELPWADEPARASWREWHRRTRETLEGLQQESARLFQALEKHDLEEAARIHPRWVSSHEAWGRSLDWAVEEQEKGVRATFGRAESRVSQLRTGLEVVLGVVISLSLLLLWLGERALRPLQDLTRLVRDIARRGEFRKEDKSLLPELMLARNDEVSQLAREFHRMATALLEREKVVETQKTRLQDQNRMLRDMGELNHNILNSIESVLVVTDLEGRIRQANPGAVKWLGRSQEELLDQPLPGLQDVAALLDLAAALERLRGGAETIRVEPHSVSNGRTLGGMLMPLRSQEGVTTGAILVLEDLTESRALEQRLRHAEKLAAVGQMSAQVAHEVRNPLHSIGLEAEMALERAQGLASPELKQSLASILQSVDRLEQITENYLKLSRLSPGKASRFDLGDVLESVLATYAPAFESSGTRVDWSRPPHALQVEGDRALLEQALGNLVRNSLQALEGRQQGSIRFVLGQLESGRVFLRIEDNGPGIAESLRGQLFTPFLTTKASGTGLGLSFVKKVVDDCGGEIFCLPTRAGQGATFELCLPGLDARSQESLPPPFRKESNLNERIGL